MFLHKNEFLARHIGYVVTGHARRVPEAILLAQSGTNHCRHYLRGDVVIQR